MSRQNVKFVPPGPGPIPGSFRHSAPPLAKPKVIGRDEFARRRRQLMRLMGRDSIAIIPAAPVRHRNNDVEYPYRQDSDFQYLTGFGEPESVAVLVPGPRAGAVRAVRARPGSGARDLGRTPRRHRRSDAGSTAPMTPSPSPTSMKSFPG